MQLNLNSIRMDICRLCSRCVDDENSVVFNDIYIEILEAVLLEVNVAKNEGCPICRDCSVNLEKCFQFKAACLVSEDVVNPYISSSNNKMDLKDIYLLTNNLDVVPTNWNVCRLCLQCMKNELFITLKELTDDSNLKDALQKYIPEVRMESTSQVFVCKSCVQSLNNNYNFIRMCLENESRLISEFTFENMEDSILYELNLFDIDMESMAGNLEDAEMIEDSITKDQPKVAKKYCEEINRKLAMSVQKKITLPTCPICRRIFKSKLVLEKHRVVHQDTSKIQLHECSLCDFKTRYKMSLAGHSLVHTDTSKFKKFRCETCGYETIRKSNYNKHVENHKDPSEGKYKCSHCTFVSTRSDLLKIHLLTTHGDPSKAYTYNCELCTYKTMRRYDMKHHMIRHGAQPPRLYSCEQCPYKSRWRRLLTNHQMKHKPQEQETFICFHCSREMKVKAHLVNHMLVHRKSKNEPFRCEECPFKTKYKKHFKEHVLSHKDQSEVTMHKCDLCNYKSRFPRYVKQHMVMHTRTKYKCAECPFAAKTPSCIKKHIKRHKQSM